MKATREEANLASQAAHVIYDEASNDLFAAAAARHELNQQIFTKTMAIQVWKPEFERYVLS